MNAPNSKVAPFESTEHIKFVAEHFGLFVHFVPGLSLGSAGSLVDVGSAAKFNIEKFMDDLVGFGIEYLRFTAWHKNMIPLYPSDVMKTWRGPHASLERDLIGEILDAAAIRGIKVQLYTHPRDGHDFTLEDRVKTGWGQGAAEGNPNPNPADFSFTTWNTFIREAYTELLERYGERISGIYLDEGSELGDSEWVVDYIGLGAIIRKMAPGAVIMQNYYGNIYSCDIADHEYGRWGEFEQLSGENWPTFIHQSVSTVVGSTWWAATSSPRFSPGYSHQNLFRYLVMQIASSKVGGGVAFAAGPFLDGGWEAGVTNLITMVGSLYGLYREALAGTRPSSRWPIEKSITFDSLAWGVALDRGNETFLHVLKPPQSGTLQLEKPADESQIVAVCAFPSLTRLEFTVNHLGTVEIDVRSLVWDSTDTVLLVKTIAGKISFQESGANE